MASEIKTAVKKIEKEMIKLRNKVNRSDLDFTVQISLSTADPETIRYATQMVPPAEGLAPVTFISIVSADDLVKKIKEFSKILDYDTLEIAYHDAQIDACKRTIEGHEERKKEILEKDNPKEETNEDQSETG